MSLNYTSITGRWGTLRIIIQVRLDILAFFKVLPFLPFVLHFCDELVDRRQRLRLSLQLLPLEEPRAVQRLTLHWFRLRGPAAEAADKLHVPEPFLGISCPGKEPADGALVLRMANFAQNCGAIP